MKLKNIVCAAFITVMGVMGVQEANAQVNVRIGPARHHRTHARRTVVRRNTVVVHDRPVVVRERTVVRRHRAHRRYR